MDDQKYVREVSINSRTIEIVIIRRRRKTMAIHVFPDRPVELRVPLKCPWSAIDGFLAERREWIGEAVHTLAGDRLPNSPKYVAGEHHHYLGEPHRLVLSEGRTRRVSIAGDVMSVRCPDPDDSSEVQRAIAQVLSCRFNKRSRRQDRACCGRT